MSNQPWSEQFRLASKDWIALDSAATMLEETKSAVLAQRMTKLGDMPVAKAERIVKASDEWLDYITRMVKAREAANLANAKLQYIKMRAWEESNENANKRAEMRL